MFITRRTVLAGALASGAGRLLVPETGRRARAASGVSVPMGGINLAGADFGKIPGVHGTEYLYPPLKHFEYFRNLGFALIRLPFKWERLQPAINAPFAPNEQRILTEMVRNAALQGQRLVLDPHNYAKRRISADGWSKEHGIGSSAVPVGAFADLWSRLALQFKDNEHVIFGLMNEPVGINVAGWLNAANAAIAAIRATGATNLILVPGIEYSGAHSWFTLGNTAMAGVEDPGDNFAFDVHQYFDRDSSGTQPDAVSGMIGSERIEGFQNWAREHGFRAVLGEFNGGRNRTAFNALHDICQEMAANADVWMGWAAWAGGPRWPNTEMFNLEPWVDGRTREQTAILSRYARPQSEEFWVAGEARIDLDFARDRFFGVASPDDTLLGPANDSIVSGLLRGKGIRLSTPRRAAGVLLALLQTRTFTLVIQTRELEQGVCDILSGSGRLLRREVDGAVTGPVASLATGAQPLANWRAKRRIAISFDRQRNRVIMAATGGGVVLAETAVPPIDAARLGDGAALGGFVTRLIAYATPSDPETLDGLVR
jgi:endoglucanase